MLPKRNAPQTQQKQATQQPMQQQTQQNVAQRGYQQNPQGNPQGQGRAIAQQGRTGAPQQNIAQQQQGAGGAATQRALAGAIQVGKLNSKQLERTPFFGSDNLGTYDLEVLRIVEGAKRDGALFWTAEFLVHASTNPAVPVGSKIQYWRDYRFPEATANDIAKFICNGFSMSDEEYIERSGVRIDYDQFGNAQVVVVGPNQFSGEEQILTGEWVRVRTNHYQSKVSKKDRTGFQWSPIERSESEQPQNYGQPSTGFGAYANDFGYGAPPMPDEDVPF